MVHEPSPLVEIPVEASGAARRGGPVEGHLQSSDEIEFAGHSEIERRYVIGPIIPALNRPQLDRHAAKQRLNSPEAALRDLVTSGAPAGWFGFKAGGPALALGERLGFLTHYRSQLRFVLLLRRDVVGQAVSIVEAKSAGRWRANQAEQQPVRADDYAYEPIEQAVLNIQRGLAALSDRLAKSHEVVPRLYYEDFAD